MKTSFRRSGIFGLLLGVSFLLPTIAEAWDGVTSGRITQIDMTGPLNYDTRIHLGGQSMCGIGSPDWAYLNHDHGNYQAMVGLLLTAWSIGREVGVYTNKDSAGYCQIGFIVVTSN